MTKAKFFDDVTIDKVLDAYKRLDYPLFVNGDFNINIFGIRDNENVADSFNDLICLLYKEKGKWVLKKYQATTDPGIYYRNNLLNTTESVNKLKDIFTIKYTALVQRKPVKLWRDSNKDGILDRKGKTYTELAGINIHHASSNGTSVTIGKYSAGCQVIASITDWNEFIDIVLKSSTIYGKVFSYALFTESQFFNKAK